MKNKIIGISILLVLLLFAPWHSIFSCTFINWDAAGYYQFLPAVFIYHDFNFNHWANEALLPYPFIEIGGIINYGVSKILISKYSLGVAILQMPFFLLSYICAYIFNYRLDGFSFPFQLGCYLSGLFYLVAGLRMSYLIARKYFSKSASFLSVLLAVFGTNLFAFGVVSNNFSHLYGFFTIAAFILSLHQLQKSQHAHNYIFASLAFTMAVLVRSTNAIALIFAFFLLFEKRKLIFRKENLKKILAAVFISAIPVLLQISYWKYLTGHCLVLGYFENGEGFDFLHTHLFEGLFSTKKGWLVHTPLAIIGLLFSFRLYFINRKLFVACISFLILWCYVIFSWKVWYYDGGMSARPMVEVTSIVALFLAAGIEYFYNNRIAALLFIPLFSFLLYLNMIQTWMIQQGIYPLVFVAKADYVRSIFGLKDIIEYKSILKSSHHIDEMNVQNSSLLVDSLILKDKSCIGLEGLSIYKNIYAEKLKTKNLKNGMWIRIEGSGFYESKNPLLGNKCFLVFSIAKDGVPYSYQSSEIATSVIDTIPDQHRPAEKFSYDFKISEIENENDLLQIYLWNESQICYHLTSANVQLIEIK